jgi:hypothetical protein
MIHDTCRESAWIMANSRRIFLLIMINTFRLDPVQGGLYSNFRLVPIHTRDNNTWYEITAFRFFDGQGKKITPTSATNPGGRNPWYGQPINLIDDNIDSKFVDRNMQPVEFTFNVGVSALSYEWVTGTNGGDMISWRLEGGKFAYWTTLHTVSNYDTTLNRKAVVGPFLLLHGKEFAGIPANAYYGCSSGLLGHVLPACWAMCWCKSYLELVYSLSLSLSTHTHTHTRTHTHLKHQPFAVDPRACVCSTFIQASTLLQTYSYCILPIVVQFMFTFLMPEVLA